MIPARFKLCTLAALLLSTQAQAIGFGEMVLHSRVGEALRAEVPILLSESEAIQSTACFSLAPLEGSDLPVISSARTQLLRTGNKYRLLITGNKPIAEPISVIGLRAGCGFDLQRDYTLMPAEPLMTAEAAPPASPATSVTATGGKRQSRHYSEWQASDGDTLESIAEAAAPNNMAQQQRLLSALKRANPDLLPSQALAAGQRFRMPALRQTTPAESDTLAKVQRPRPARSSEQALATSDAPPAAQASAQPKTGNSDRVVLGAPPEDVVAKPNQPPQRGSMAEMEDRMLRLETTLHQLNQEVEKLNKALELTAETMVAQQKLQMAQALQARPASEGALTTTHTAPASSPSATRDSWLELLFSALLGGGIAAGLAHLLSRRRRQPTLEQLITHPATPVTTTAASPAPAALQESFPLSVAPTTAVDIPLDGISEPSQQPDSVAVDFNESASALELAEIMLSYGRVKGAAETLAQHIEQNAPDNVQPWLMLLDLYRRGDMRAEFDSLSQRIREKFNMHIPDWDSSTTPVSGLKALEDYAHITWRLVSQWGKQECMDYLHDLIHDSRAGQRFGFPLEIVEEIALLMRVLEEGYGLTRRA